MLIYGGNMKFKALDAHMVVISQNYRFFDLSLMSNGALSLLTSSNVTMYKVTLVSSIWTLVRNGRLGYKQNGLGLLQCLGQSSLNGMASCHQVSS